MIVISGHVVAGCGHFKERLKRANFRTAYLKATGEKFVKGTLNVEVDRIIPINEHFRILGKDVAESEDFLLEICRIGRIWAYRIRPHHPVTGKGGHGDNCIEIICSKVIPNVDATKRTPIAITLFRDDLCY
jgi:CTP-dependent riboflavin kinase